MLVRYAGVPEVITDPDESIEGWVPTADGAFVVGEPQGAPGWFPANDNPQDKATFDMAITVPDGLTALGNGVLAARFSPSRAHDLGVARGPTRWPPTWRRRPTAASTLTQSRVGGIPVYNAVDPTLSAELGPLLDEVPDIVRFFSALYGPYPFNAAGAIVDDAPDVGYALESQTKPNFAFVPDEATLVHELAHQWFGDAVTLRQWPDIWLHEGFAAWSEWIWSERHGGPSAQEIFEELFNDAGDAAPLGPARPAACPRPPSLFSDSVYDRGAMTLQALRVEVGDATFFRILRDWFAQHRYGNATTADFIALAERDSHRNLRGFFQLWLDKPGRVGTPNPAAAPQPAATLAAPQHRALRVRPVARPSWRDRVGGYSGALEAPAALAARGGRTARRCASASTADDGPSSARGEPDISSRSAVPAHSRGLRRLARSARFAHRHTLPEGDGARSSTSRSFLDERSAPGQSPRGPRQTATAAPCGPRARRRPGRRRRPSAPRASAAARAPSRARWWPTHGRRASSVSRSRMRSRRVRAARLAAATPSPA